MIQKQLVFQPNDIFFLRKVVRVQIFHNQACEFNVSDFRLDSNTVRLHGVLEETNGILRWEKTTKVV